MSVRWKTKKSWREKLGNPPEGLPKVVEGPAKWQKTYNALLASGQR